MKINKKIYFSYNLIRKLSYDLKAQVFKSDYNFNINNFSSSLYKYFKIRFNPAMKKVSLEILEISTSKTQIKI